MGDLSGLHEAMYYETKRDNNVQCTLCPHFCYLKMDEIGRCRVRKNIGGKLYTLNYGLCSSMAMDPIEKKPLYHFYPGSGVFSIGTVGCNFTCDFCQNWQIAQQTDVQTQFYSPEQIVRMALKERNCIGIAYTYSEPGMWYEFVLDTAQIAHKEGLKNVYVTNGYLNPEPLKSLLPYIDAVNLDVKAFTEAYYEKICSGKLDSVLKSAEIMAREKCHLELTTLLVTELNDSEAEVQRLVEWAAGLGKDTPLHFSRYVPQYKMECPATPIRVLKDAYKIAKKKLNYVYLGNIFDPHTSNTYCPYCGKLLIDRSGYHVENDGLVEGKCLQCKARIAICGTEFFSLSTLL